MYNPQSSYDCPNPLASPKEKEDKIKYGLPYAKYIYSSYMRYGSRGLFFHNRYEADQLIRFAQGLQDPNQFKNMMNVTDVKNGTPVNIDWEIVNYATKLVNVAKGMLVNEVYQATLKAIDPLALNQKKEFKNRLSNFVRNRAFIESLGIKTEFHDMENLPQNNDEIDVHMSMTYKEEDCMAMELLCELFLEANSYEQLKEEQSLDLLCQGAIASWSELDSNGSIKLNYVDPRRAIIPPSKFPDFRDITWGGYLDEMSIHDLRQKFGNQFTEDQYQDILGNYKVDKCTSAIFGNTGSNYHTFNTSNILVMRFFFMSDNEDVYEKGMTKYGNKVFTKTDYKTGLSDKYKTEVDENGTSYRTNGKNKIYRDKYKVVYEGFWIVGSDYIGNYGLKTNMERVKGNLVDVVPSLRMYAPNMKDGRVVPLVRQMRPKLQSLQRLNLKLQNAIASAVPKGIKINLAALRNVNLQGADGKVMNEQQLIALYYQKGIILEDSDFVGMQGVKPIEELENGMAADVLSFLQLIQAEVLSLNELIGTNSITNASTPSSDMLVGVAQASQEATNNAFTFLFNAQRWMYKQLVSSIINLGADSIKQGAAQQITDAIGEISVESILKASTRLYEAIIQIKPNAAQWQSFYAMVSASVEKGVISMSDFLYIQDIDNFKEARQYFMVLEKRRAKEAAAAKQQDVKDNMMAQQASNQQANQNALSQFSAEGEMKMKVISAEIEKEKVVHILKMEELQKQIELQGINAINLARVQGQEKVHQIRVQGEEDAHNQVLGGEIEKNMPETKKASD